MHNRLRITLLRVPALILLFAFCRVSNPASAQVEGQYGITADGAFVQPVFGLGDRFSGTGTGSIGFGIWAANDTFVEGRAEFYALRQGEIRFTDDVMTEDGPTIDAEQLNLTLDIFGAAVHIRRLLAIGTGLRPYMAAGAGLYNWVSRRDPYEDENRTVVPLRQAQVSGGFHGGLGLEYALTSKIHLDAGVRHTMIMGELWPSLHLGLDNVSTFQLTSGRLGIRYYF